MPLPSAAMRASAGFGPQLPGLQRRARKWVSRTGSTTVQAASTPPGPRPRRRQVVSGRFFDDDARQTGQAQRTEPFDHRGEQCERNGKVMRRAPGIDQRLLECRECTLVVVITAHKMEPRHPLPAR